jgi:hypothetical protein
MAEQFTIDDLSAGIRRQVTALRPSITAAAKQFAVIREKLSDLAPKVVRLYNEIQAENERFTFVEFARLFDNTIPTHPGDRGAVEGYRKHRVYYTLTYMRRLVQTSGRRGQQGVRDSAADALARTLATILQVVAEPEPVWTAIQQEFGYTERLMGRLRKRVEATEPLFKLSVPKPAKIGNVIHMPKAQAAAPAAGELAEPGRAVRQQGRRRAA